MNSILKTYINKRENGRIIAGLDLLSFLLKQKNFNSDIKLNPFDVHAGIELTDHNTHIPRHYTLFSNSSLLREKVYFDILTELYSKINTAITYEERLAASVLIEKLIDKLKKEVPYHSGYYRFRIYFTGVEFFICMILWLIFCYFVFS